MVQELSRGGHGMNTLVARTDVDTTNEEAVKLSGHGRPFDETERVKPLSGDHYYTLVRPIHRQV